MTLKGAFVDDQDDVFAETLSTPGKLELRFMAVDAAAQLARNLFAQHPSLVALDYRLDEAPANLSADQTYKGSALAQHLRDACAEQPEHDFPIVLVSAEAKIQSLYQPDKTAHDLFDRVYVKERIVSERATIRQQLLSLAEGYNRLKEAVGRFEWAALAELSPDDADRVSIQELRVKLADGVAPHVVARTFLTTLIDRSGPLLSSADVAAVLGVELAQANELASYLEPAGLAYTGIFATGWQRWWAYRIDDWALEIFKRRPTGLPASERAKIVSQLFGAEFRPAPSPWNGSAEELIAFSCASCGRGTELKHSVAAFEAAVPRYVTRRRICWDCVQTDRYREAQSLLIDENDDKLAAAVRTMERKAAEA